MQCPRCGRVLNLEERRCPNCLASLSNEKIGTGEQFGYALKEAADIERANLWNRRVKRAVISGAIVPVLLIITLSWKLVVVGAVIGAGTGWLIGWRHWGHNRACIVYALVMALPTLAIVGFNPFTFLLVASVGMLIGLAVDGAEGL